MKCRKIEIYDPQEDCYTEIKVNAVFHLATISGLAFPECEKIGYYGFNVGIAIPINNAEEGEAFFKRYWDPVFSQAGELKIYLIGGSGEKVPVRVREGHMYDPAYESCCLFGYIVPSVLASDPPPKWKKGKKGTFGSYFAQLRK